MPDSWVALLIALLAVVPGGLTVTIWARSRTWRGPTGDLRTILQALAIGAVIQVVMFPLTVMVVLPHWRSPDDYAVSLGAWLLLTVLALPVVLGLGTARLTDCVFPLRTADTNFGWLRRFLRGAIKPVAPATMWDWWLTEGVPNGRFVLAKFRDGSYIGGVFSDGSMAQTSPEPHGIYLASEWLVDEAGTSWARFRKLAVCCCHSEKTYCGCGFKATTGRQRLVTIVPSQKALPAAQETKGQAPRSGKVPSTPPPPKPSATRRGA